MSIAGEPLLGAFNVDVEQPERTVRRLARLEAGIVCVGHGPAITEDARGQLPRLRTSEHARRSRRLDRLPPVRQ
jgi:hypothetical protein